MYYYVTTIIIKNSSKRQHSVRPIVDNLNKRRSNQLQMMGLKRSDWPKQQPVHQKAIICHYDFMRVRLHLLGISHSDCLHFGAIELVSQRRKFDQKLSEISATRSLVLSSLLFSHHSGTFSKCWRQAWLCSSSSLSVLQNKKPIAKWTNLCCTPQNTHWLLAFAFCLAALLSSLQSVSDYFLSVSCNKWTAVFTTGLCCIKEKHDTKLWFLWVPLLVIWIGTMLLAAVYGTLLMRYHTTCTIASVQPTQVSMHRYRFFLNVWNA